jgi:hypothetical protein
MNDSLSHGNKEIVVLFRNPRPIQPPSTSCNSGLRVVLNFDVSGVDSSRYYLLLFDNEQAIINCMFQIYRMVEQIVTKRMRRWLVGTLHVN